MSRVGWFLLYLLVFWGTTLVLALVLYATALGTDKATLRGIAIFVGLTYFLWAMPKTGRPSWYAFGLIVPFLNAYLFFSTFWRLAGLRTGMFPWWKSPGQSVTGH